MPTSRPAPVSLGLLLLACGSSAASSGAAPDEGEASAGAEATQSEREASAEAPSPESSSPESSSPESSSPESSSPDSSGPDASDGPEGAEANERSVCEAAAACCRAFVAQLGEGAGLGQSDQSACGTEGIEGSDREATCRTGLEGYRAAFEREGEEVPSACRAHRAPSPG